MLVQYEENGEYHERIVLLHVRQSTYWILTASGDVYPEELSCPPLAGIAACNLDGAPIPELCIGARSHRGQIFEFGQPVTPAQYEQVRAAWRAQNQGRRTPPLDADWGLVPVANAAPAARADGAAGAGLPAASEVALAAAPALQPAEAAALKLGKDLRLVLGEGKLPAPVKKW